LNSTHKSFPEFEFKIHSESREVSIRKVVPGLKPFITIFYFKFFESGKTTFRVNHV
jgi:hypothetical protein